MTDSRLRIPATENSSSTPAPGPARQRLVAPAPAAPLAAPTIHLGDTLRALPLLTPAQRNELDGKLAPRFPDARDLARELLRRNWLTPYQVNQLLQGRGQDLVVDHYVLLERLGEGGAGQVFKARHLHVSRIVALKVIRKELLTEAEVLTRFSREIQVLSQLDHPNIVRAYDAGAAGGAHFLAMEYVEGTDLGRLVKQGGPMPVLQACEYIRQAALGLQHAHERGLVHRDIKPHNLIMSVRDGLIKVADLGLARLPRSTNRQGAVTAEATQGTGTVTPNNSVIGTPDYMAPEQALEFHCADIRADIYSLGCTFFFLLAGQPPFPGGTLAQTLLRHQQAPPPTIDSTRPDIPAGLSAVIARMLAKRPEDRYQTPADVATALDSLTGQSPPAQLGRLRLPMPFEWRPRTRRQWLLVAGIVAILLMTAFAFLYRTEDRVRQDALQVIMTQPGTPDAVKSARLLIDLPSPLDQLDSKHIPSELRMAGLPAEVVAVLHPGGTPGEANRVVFSLDAKALASCGKDGRIHLWDTATGKKRATLKVHTGPIRGLAFSPDGKGLASASEDKSVRLWDLVKGGDRALPGTAACEWDLTAFSLDGKWLAAGNRHGMVCLWDLPGLNKKADYRAKHGIHSLVFAPDGQTVALGTDETIEFLTVPTAKDPTLVAMKAGRMLSYAPNGRALAHSGGEAPFFRLRDLETGTAQALELKQELGNGPRFLGHTLDGRSLVAANGDGSAIMWDAATRQQVGFWQMPWASFTLPLSADLASDGRHLATAHQNGIIYIRRLVPAAKK